MARILFHSRNFFFKTLIASFVSLSILSSCGGDNQTERSGNTEETSSASPSGEAQSDTTATPRGTTIEATTGGSTSGSPERTERSDNPDTTNGTKEATGGTTGR